MKIRCKINGCKRLAKTYNKEIALCEIHRCRCKEDPATGWFRGCYIHKGRD